ncbi:MAG: hypothetical protein C4294_02340, partial [Nitrospiraceae bacterium]
MPARPLVTVLMSVFNNAGFVEGAVQSILQQTYKDFELLIIDDGSTDGTFEVLSTIQDSRIRLKRNGRNLGLTTSLRLGLEEARGQYVARMDADDIALPQRLEKQVAFLDANPKVGILGSACRELDVNGRELGLRRVPVSDLEIRWVSLLNNPFLHPTVMLRRDVLTSHQLNYDASVQTAQDYDLWIRMLMYTSGANLCEPLIHYRLGPGVTSTQREWQLRNHDSIAFRAIQNELPDFAITPQQASLLRRLFVGRSDAEPPIESQRVELTEIYLDLLNAFIKRHVGAAADLKILRRQESVKAAIVALRRPLLPGWIHVMARLL